MGPRRCGTRQCPLGHSSSTWCAAPSTATISARSRANLRPSPMRLPLLERLTDPVRQVGVRRVAGRPRRRLPGSVIQSLQRRLGGKPGEVASTMKRGTARERVEREVLRLIVRGDVDPIWHRYSTPADFASPKQRVVVRRASDRLGWDPGAITAVSDTDLAARVAALAVEPLEGDPSPAYAERGRRSAARVRAEGAQRRTPREAPETEPNDRCRIRRPVQATGRSRRRAPPPAGRVTVRLLPYTVRVVMQTPQDSA